MAKIPTLVGPDGVTPLRREVLLDELAGPTMAGVRRPIGEHPSRGLTPARLGTILRASEEGDPVSYLELAEDIEEKDLHYVGVLGARKRAVAQLEITVEAAEDKGPWQEHADFIREWLRRDELEDELFDMLDAIGKGFSVVEILWETSEKQWWPRRLEWRDPRWFMFDLVDLRTIRLRDDAGQPVPLAPYKFITSIIQAKSGLPIRGGLARPVSWAWLFKNFGLKDWVSFLETYGQPLRLGMYPNGSTPEDRRMLLRAVSQLGHDAGGIIPDSMKIDFVESASKGDGALFSSLANFLDQQISKAVLGQVGTTDAIAGGYAVGKVHDQVRQDIQQSDAKRLAIPINRDLVKPMIDLNFGPPKDGKYPRVFIGLPDQTDMAKLMPLIEKYVDMGGKVGSSVVRDKLGLPDPDKDEELLQPRRRASPGAPNENRDGASDPEQDTATAAAQARGDRDAVTELADEAIDDWRPMVEPIVDPVRQLLEDVTSLEELRDRLPELIEEMEPDEVITVLAQAGFAARLAGEVDAPIDDSSDAGA
ncbi:DUF935 domain-containing protein [Thalassobaculum sp. OXR-137]|uniref:DUF935 domain-containing protein n=1 Tax=Thalassobaculum sp. OXR-137 TaxID=3100173 RepID=UPI002AC94A78|nr:DUF935 domain-containing protein [Thalassobaculum sp. OXR-137]WPZ33216.1 DUF935 domain-containing protein [Thalassobaculum sp. OXR-137]WPZ34891.1 DUF935 domain-containing protein [Thalassobaculum sp. OXR-137]